MLGAAVVLIARVEYLRDSQVRRGAGEVREFFVVRTANRSGGDCAVADRRRAARTQNSRLADLPASPPPCGFGNATRPPTRMRPRRQQPQSPGDTESRYGSFCEGGCGAAALFVFGAGGRRGAVEVAVEGLATDAQHAGGFALVASAGSNHARDVAALHFFERQEFARVRPKRLISRLVSDEIFRGWVAAGCVRANLT